MKAVVAIRTYFDNPKPTTSEVAELSKEERQELGRLACIELGEEFEPSDS